MRTITADRTKVLTAIRANYEKHKADYLEALEGWKNLVLARLVAKEEEFADSLKRLRTTFEKFAPALDAAPPSVHFQNFSTSIDLRPPTSHAKAYETAIAMLEFEVRDTIELDTAEFEAYVRDNWDWADEFQAVSAVYKMSAKSVTGHR